LLFLCIFLFFYPFLFLSDRSRPVPTLFYYLVLFFFLCGLCVLIFSLCLCVNNFYLCINPSFLSVLRALCAMSSFFFYPQRPPRSLRDVFFLFLSSASSALSARCLLSFSILSVHCDLCAMSSFSFLCSPCDLFTLLYLYSQ